MKNFLRKNGKSIAVAVAVIACISFLVYVAALGSGYYSSVENQAVSRADDYVYEQAAHVSAQLEAVKTSAEFFAEEVSSKKDKESFHNTLSSIKSFSSEKDLYFADIYYSVKDKIYTARGDEYEASPEMYALLSFEGTGVSKNFSYENTFMAFAVTADAECSFSDKIIIVYDSHAVSLESFVYEGTEENKTLIPSVKDSEFVVLCKYDGRIMERVVVNEKFDPGTDTVQDGILKKFVKKSEDYAKITAMCANDGKGAVSVTIDGSAYVFAVYSLSPENGNIFILALYDLSALYGEGYTLISTIYGAMGILAVAAAFGLISFIVSQIKMNAKIRKLATQDEELDCPTRDGFEYNAESILQRYKATSFAVIILQIQSFDYLSEKFGEAEKLRALKFIRNVCYNSLVTGETYAYIKDGQFLLLLHYRDRKGLIVKLKGIYNQITKYDEFPDKDYKINVSYSIYEVNGGEKQSVRRMVDKAKIVKNESAVKTSEASFNFYGDMLKENYAKRAEIEGRMNIALENNEFHLFYQPKYNLGKKTIDGSEILVRWFDSKIDAYRSPAEFLPLFEENGFINKLDRFVFYRACQNIAECIEKHIIVFPVSVNISRVTAIQPDFLAYYTRIKKKFNIKDNFITLEFTESFAYENYEYLAGIVNELHAAGFMCSLDDFGTGYSSFSVLKELEMDEIKLDKVFLDRSSHPDRDEMLLQSVIGMVKKIGTKITQEGVENKEQFDKLIAYGCDVVQGFYFARPMKYSDYRQFVEENFSKK